MTNNLPRWIWITAIVVSFALGAALHLPARLALRLAGVTLEGVSIEGTVLSWHAHRSDGWDATFDASAFGLLLGRYAGVLQVANGESRFRGHIAREWNGVISFGDGEFATAIGPLAGSLGLPPSLIEGQLVVRDIGGIWRANAIVSLRCVGEVRGVRAGPGAQAITIGDLGVTCADDVGGPVISVEDHGGPLAFRSAVRFGADGRFLVEGTAGARPGAPADLVQALPLLGRDSGPNQVSFRYAGALPRL